MLPDDFGSARFRRALNSTGAELLHDPVQYGSFYCHARIAKGGQGEVFLATGDEEAVSRVCVVKAFSDSNQETLKRAARSLRTQLRLVDIASGLSAPMYSRDEQVRPAPWIPDILAYDLGAKVPWVAQDFRGPSLRRALVNERAGLTCRGSYDRRTPKQVRTWLLSQIVDAVEFIHTRGVIHRDLKPDNILVEYVDSHNRLTESVALCDFDLSKMRDSAALTRTAVGMGTAGYSAPEQLFSSARRATPACDVYSVAMVAIFLFSGRKPQRAFIGDGLLNRKLDPGVADQLGGKREWIEKALSVEPDERPPLSALQAKLYGPAAGE